MNDLYNKKGFGNKWRWYYYAQSYFLLANLACQHLSDPHDKYSKAIGAEELFPSLKYNNKDLIIPIIFNIRHGIELFLKGIMRQLKVPLPHQEEKSRSGHNLQKLYNKLIENIGDKKELNSSMLSLLKELESLIEKWKTFAGYDDPQNIFFKYPEEKKEGHITLRQEEINENSKKLCDIKKDLIFFYKKFNEIGGLLQKLKEQTNKNLR